MEPVLLSSSFESFELYARLDRGSRLPCLCNRWMLKYLGGRKGYRTCARRGVVVVMATVACLQAAKCVASASL